MARKPSSRQNRAPERPERRADRTEDTAMRSLSKEERARLSMDAWEPSLLRHLLRAQDKLRGR